MNIFSAIVVYVCIWWIVFFCTLPFGIKNIAKPKKGEMPGAPVNPGLKRKFIVASAIAAVLWVAAYAVITSDLLSFHDMALKMSM
jgi:predicted secreted protein